MPVIKDNKNLFTLDKGASGAQRKMAAIFAADVVGYSRLMAENEKLTLFRLKETRKLTDTIIKKLDGRIFSTAGDSIMAEFASPVDAVEAAIEIQNEVKKNIDEITDNVKIEFRIGVNLGDIMVQDNNLYGDNVNIAARLESISNPGEICISEKVYQEIKNKVNIKFGFSGTKKLKNISEKVKVYSSNLNNPSNENNKSRINISFSLIKISAISFLAIVFIIGIIYFFKKYSNNTLEYSEESKSVLENFRSAQESNDASIDIAHDGKIVLAFMDIQNQSSNFDNKGIDDLKLFISNNLSINETIAVINSPEGAENLNPPEVMLIATESNASFVINGIIFDESKNSFLNLKIYEAKRGSLILNKKILLSQDNNDLKKFIIKFTKDITNN